MPKPDTVSAVIPTYNRADLLPDAIDSVLGQTRTPDRLIVVNDGSTDHTEQVLSSYGARIEVLYQDNSGKSVALNNALKHIESGWVWLFDDDDIAYPDCIETHLDAITEAPDTYFTYSARTDLFFDDEGNIRNQKQIDLPHVPEGQLLPVLLENSFFSLQGALVHASCFNTLSFREDLYRAMDYEFMLRLVRHFAGVRIDRPTFYVRRHTGLRGPATARFAARDVSRHWHINEKQFFAELYHELALAEYLGAAALDGPNAYEAQQLRARLTRATVMARKGLWHLAIPDLEVVAHTLGPARTLDDTEQRTLQRLTTRDHPLFELLDDWSMLVRLHRIFNTLCDSDERFTIVQDMYFTLARSNAHDSASRKTLRALRLLYLLGWRGTAKYIDTKVKHVIKNTSHHKPDAT